MQTHSQHIVALAGGVGGARMLQGFAGAIGDDSSLTAIVNTADDFELYGLYISPDIDTVMYTLAGLANPATGWGIVGDTTVTLGAIERLSETPWFTLGDQDLATHILRTERLRRGDSLSHITAGFASKLGISTRILPMSDAPVRTEIQVADGWLDFQSYFVGRRHADPVLDVRFAGIEAASAGTDVVDAIDHADIIVICPSNPVVSIDPILQTGGIREAIIRSPARVLCVSPIVGGRAIKGPAADMLASKGFEVSARGVSDWYGDLVDVMIIDEVDEHHVEAIKSTGRTVTVLQTVMGDESDRIRLATQILEAL